MAVKQTSDGKKGGLLKGKPHNDSKGNPVGGIKAVVSDTKQMVELEGGEVIINKEASKKHWKELSKINHFFLAYVKKRYFLCGVKKQNSEKIIDRFKNENSKNK